MRVETYSYARDNLKKLISSVCEDHMPTLITNKNNSSEQAILIAKEDYDSIYETLYLLKSPANAKILLESIKEAKEGKTVDFDLLRD